MNHNSIGERRDHDVVWLTFQHPERLNSFTADAYRDLHLALARLDADPQVHVVVLTGTGRAFSAGADRSLLTRDGDRTDQQRAGMEFDRLLEALAGFEKPLFAAVNGLAVGFGATLLLYCDVVIAAAGARFRFPFTSLGLVPEAGSSVLLPARMRWADAMWSVLSSEWLDAVDAERAGLVWRVVADEELAAATTSAAHQVAAQNPNAVRESKRLLTAGRAQAVKAAVACELAAIATLFAPTC